MINDPIVAIIYCRKEKYADKWARACEKAGVVYRLFDLVCSDALKYIMQYSPDLILTRPPGTIELDKTLYDEKCYILAKHLKYMLFPSFEESIIYENKKMLSYFMDANGISHPKTWVFYDFAEAANFVEKYDDDIVFKSSIGASGSGVLISRSKQSSMRYLKRAFSKRGIEIQIGPNRLNGNPLKWIKKAISNPELALERFGEYKAISDNRPRKYVIAQEFIPHSYEWRAVKIGDSYFAHQKTKIGDKCSGTKGIDYVDPPIDILNFVRNLCESNSFISVAIDLFEHKGSYLVNEIQTIFGHVQDHILEVDGKPGRYIYVNGSWVFEEGMFNSNESYDLRLEAALSYYDENTKRPN